MKKEEYLHKKFDKSITWDDVEILFIGAGTMGSSLAQAYAQNGFNVGILDISDEILQKAFETINNELEVAKAGGIFSEAQIRDIKARILGTTSYEEACKGQNLKLVVETATERIDIKKQIFKKLDELCAPHVILATNSSSLDINILARVTKRPDKVVWMHYFYLPHKNRGGEYAGTDTASPESIKIAAKYMKLGGKVAVPILSSRKGGAADIIFVALLLEATRMLEEGYDIPTIESAGKKAFNIPLGFLSLMDATGLPVGLYSMKSFSDASDPDAPLYRGYGNFFTPCQNFIELMKKYESADDKSAVKWVPEKEAKKEPQDMNLVNKLKERFLAVSFMTAAEVVDSKVIRMEDVERLAQNAFLWREGPFTLMNKIGMREVMRLVNERAELAKKQGIHFPIPKLLIEQAGSGKPWPLKISPIICEKECNNRVARITISNPRSANALDNEVFEDLRNAFKKANEDEDIKGIIFDSAPIKTFIAGANVPNFIERIKEGNFQAIKDDTTMWQEVLFHEMTGTGKPKVAIIDGMTFGGGVEVAMAFAFDPNSVVIITDRTSFTLPETRLGIYPGLRGTLLLPQLIYRATNDAELAVAISRYYILAGGTSTSSPRIIKYLGMADFLVPAHKRDEVAQIVAKAIIDNKGKPLTREQLAGLNIKELPTKLTYEEREELRLMKDLFLKKDLIPTLYAYGRGQAEIFLSGYNKGYVRRIAQRVANNSPNAVWIANWLISKGFDDFLKGENIEKLAQRELEEYLIPTFQHPDAIIGLRALTERKFPEFKRTYPF
ncbi:MAG: 3-hydroxyacyl-CoA dehydrogenase/enoyl-CoA hydratase family protein [Candidatus Aminicenantia bacterium]